MKILNIKGKTSYIARNGALIGLYFITESQVLMIDSGVKPDEEMLDFLRGQKLDIKAVLCTHMHPDHVANNQALHRDFGAQIYMTEEPFRFKWEGYPYSIICPGKQEFYGVEIEAVTAYGHSPGQLALITPDNVCFVGDAVISQPLLAQSKLPYIEDVEQAIISMEKLRGLNCDYFVAAHEAVLKPEEFSALVDENIQKELELYEKLRLTVDKPMEIEQAIDIFMDELGVTKKVQSYEHTREPVRARLRTLAKAGELIIEGGTVRTK